VRERLKPKIELADLKDRGNIMGKNGEIERLKIGMEARSGLTDGLVTLDADAKDVTADLKKIGELTT
jgi:hypothetical protein